MNISFDLDGVLYPWHEVVVSYVNMYEKPNPPITVETFVSHIENRNKLYLDYILENPTLYSVRSPRKMDITLVNKLAETHNIFYITSRPQLYTIQYATHKWLKTWKFPQYKNLIFSNDKKTTIIENDINVHIEDQVRHVESVKNFCKVYMVTQPWNLTYENSAVTRIYDLMELYEYV